MKPIIGITLGDYNGIGPEVILKSLASPRLLKWCTPVIYGSAKVLDFYRQKFELKEWSIAVIQEASEAKSGESFVINCWDDSSTVVEPGKETKEAGKAAFDCLERAANDLDRGLISALVTAPIKSSFSGCKN